MNDHYYQRLRPLSQLDLIAMQSPAAAAAATVAGTLASYGSDL